jgi:hypothetical protein
MAGPRGPRSRDELAQSYGQKRLAIPERDIAKFRLSSDKTMLKLDFAKMNDNDLGIEYSRNKQGKLSANFSTFDNGHATKCLIQINKLLSEISDVTQAHNAQSQQAGREVLAIQTFEGCKIEIDDNRKGNTNASPMFPPGNTYLDKSLSHNISKQAPTGASVSVALHDTVFMPDDAIGLIKKLQSNPNLSFDLTDCDWLKKLNTPKAESILLQVLLTKPELVQRLPGYEERFKSAQVAQAMMGNDTVGAVAKMLGQDRSFVERSAPPKELLTATTPLPQPVAPIASAQVTPTPGQTDSKGFLPEVSNSAALSPSASRTAVSTAPPARGMSFIAMSLASANGNAVSATAMVGPKQHAQPVKPSDNAGFENKGRKLVESTVQNTSGFTPAPPPSGPSGPRRR